MLHKVLSIVLLAIAMCACKDKPVKSTAPIEKFAMVGEVISIDVPAHTAKIKHEEIKGWMEAMTMDYPVKDPAELTSLQVGEHITATAFVQGLQYWIGEIHKAP